MNTMKRAVAGLALVAAGYAPVAGAQWILEDPVPGSTTTTSFMGVTFASVSGNVVLDFFASGLTSTQRVKDLYFNVPTGFTPSATNVVLGAGSEADSTISFGDSSGTSAGIFDVHLSFPVGNGPHNRFTAGEHVFISVEGGTLTPASFNSWSGVAHNGYFAVAGLNPTAYIAAVPEPETYAMMIAGLALMGWMARRRRQSLQPDPV